jgi:uncharacterized protein (TIGR02266 family)
MRIVVPVRFAAPGRAVQTTSREMTPSALLLEGQRPLAPGKTVALRLYLPDSGPPAGAIGQVREAKGHEKDGFWLDVVDTVREVSERIQRMVAQIAATVKAAAPGDDGSPHRSSARFPTSIPVSIGGEKRLFAARAVNLSASGLFVRSKERLDPGVVVAVSLLLPDHDDPVSVRAKVVHVVQCGLRHAPWLEPGMGLQFIDGDDSFRARIDRHLQLAAASSSKTDKK